MRTTVRLDDQLLRDAKLFATERGETLTAILEQALRELLARRKALRKKPRVQLPTFHGRGLQPGVDLEDKAALLELMEKREDASS